MKNKIFKICWHCIVCNTEGNVFVNSKMDVEEVFLRIQQDHNGSCSAIPDLGRLQPTPKKIK
jgi:hypothetical protein